MRLIIRPGFLEIRWCEHKQTKYTNAPQAFFFNSASNPKKTKEGQCCHCFGVNPHWDMEVLFPLSTHGSVQLTNVSSGSKRSEHWRPLSSLALQTGFNMSPARKLLPPQGVIYYAAGHRGPRWANSADVFCKHCQSFSACHCDTTGQGERCDCSTWRA